MAVIISIETSTSVCSVALHENGGLVAAKELHQRHAAASQLAVQLEDLFSETRIPKRDIAAVAVSSGPGSYTGLRIGVAFAKGLSFGLEIPMIAIESLSVLASAVSSQQPGELLCPMIDARRMEVYCCLYDRALNPASRTQAIVIDSDSFHAELQDRKIIFFGDGAAKCREVITHPNASFLENLYPAAANMGTSAFHRYRTKDFVDVASFEPFYLKEFAAKTKSA
ncbi:MAG TPA: tRNA (adenosine(37)-N6)-threonylcarbamoyltransferase complex dimerization subunit type 1 TsaB [Cyclobacteriaceae bacterium]|nr:tRNA (adenosine(37)-N6)-threonylcarbamoyltransferase complex dimerization subunit type 1 TsaB [Cyclobacteriaceae bacterium]